MSFADLPDELLIEHLLLLPPAEIARTCQVDRRFARICREPYLWVRLMQRDFPEVDLQDVEDPRKFYTGYINQSKRIRSLWNVFSRPDLIQQLISSGSRIVYISQTSPEKSMVGGLPPLNFWSVQLPDIFNVPEVGPALAKMMTRMNPQASQLVEEAKTKFQSGRARW